VGPEAHAMVHFLHGRLGRVSVHPEQQKSAAFFEPTDLEENNGPRQQAKKELDNENSTETKNLFKNNKNIKENEKRSVKALTNGTNGRKQATRFH
jgi:hypothetical protein